jgi:hypothetical protein
MANELTRIDFHGDVIEAAVDETGRILVGFRRICEAMDQDYYKQVLKLRGRSWAMLTRVKMRVGRCNA